MILSQKKKNNKCAGGCALLLFALSEDRYSATTILWPCLHFVFVNIEIKTLELFTCNGWLHTIRL